MESNYSDVTSIIDDIDTINDDVDANSSDVSGSLYDVRMGDDNTDTYYDIETPVVLISQPLPGQLVSGNRYKG